jgi:hypothetical protein
MKVKIIACEVMKNELLQIKKEDNTDIEFISLGLHLYPDKLRKELQKILDALVGYSRVVLAFGLCGGAAKDLKAKDFILTVPRVHDCLPVLFGSVAAYENARKEEAGTFYLTCGWLNGEKTILSEYERTCGKFGEKKAQSIIKRTYDSYKRILFVKTGNTEEESYLKKSYQVAALLNLKHEITEGNLKFVEKIVRGPWEDQAFINLLPNSTIMEEDFFKIIS